MTLPDLCPRDGVSQCKKKACHLYVVEWRTGDEQCVIGYSSTHKQFSRSAPLEDNYASKVHGRAEQKPVTQNASWPEPAADSIRRGHLKREVPEPLLEEVYIEARPADAGQKVHEEFNARRAEKVLVNDKDTTVIESKPDDEPQSRDAGKRKSLDEVMNMDLPENYEEEFWK